MLRHNLGLVFVGAALVMGGCGAQADSSYRGTPLAQLHGSVQSSATSGLTSAPPPLEAALLWDGEVPGADAKATVSRREVGTSVPVAGQFPAQFALQVFTPPPDAALFSCFSDPTRHGMIASGSVAAMVAGTAEGPTTYVDLYGMVSDFIVIYVDTDLPADSDCPVGALAKGYHLFHSTPTPDKPGCVRAAPDDTSCNGPWPYTEVAMTTDLTLVLSHEDGNATPPPPTPTPTPIAP
jgi:hypothetical protein